MFSCFPHRQDPGHLPSFPLHQMHFVASSTPSISHISFTSSRLVSPLTFISSVRLSRRPSASYLASILTFISSVRFPQRSSASLRVLIALISATHDRAPQTTMQNVHTAMESSNWKTELTNVNLMNMRNIKPSTIPHFSKCTWLISVHIIPLNESVSHHSAQSVCNVLAVIRICKRRLTS